MQSVPKCCPSWFWVAPVPAAAMFEGSPYGQPMFMPMTAPIMTPMSEHNGLPNSNDMGYANLGGAVPQYCWSAGEPWSYPEGYFNQEDPPQQLPMEEAEGSIAQVAQWEYKEELPSQAGMDTMTMALASATIGAGTLRRRQQKGHPAEVWQNRMKPLPKMEESYSSPADGTENEQAKNAHAQKLAANLLAQFQAGGTERQSALAAFESLCFMNETTSRAAQLVLVQVSSSDAATFAKALLGNVRSAVNSKHANFVLQTIIEVTPPASFSFIIDELKGSAGKLARQQFGCRVLCRVLEHLPASDHSTFVELFDEILQEDVHELCRNEFGSYVARHLLEFGFPHHKQEVVNALRTDLLRYSKDKFASHVVEQALRHSSDEDQPDLAWQLLHNQGAFLELADSQFGRHVAKALITHMHGEMGREAVEMLLPMESKLKSMRYGKGIVQSLRAAAKRSNK